LIFSVAAGLMNLMLNQQQQKILASKWKNGRSQAEIMSYFKFSESTLYRCLRKMGLPSRRNWTSSGGQHNAWKGGRRKSEDGYILLWIPKEDPFYCMTNSQGYVLEHRYVLACYLGRPLTSSETVHHINGEHNDNSLENLQLRFGKHGKGVCFQCRQCGSTDVEAVPLKKLS